MVDKYAEDAATKDNLALLHICEGSGQAPEVNETRWNYSELSRRSRSMASALKSLGEVKRAVTILPKVPENWLLHLATMRTKTVLCPGKWFLSLSIVGLSEFGIRSS